ncbi:MAG: hypothetical protein ACE14M_08255 [Terriglobales bacterium]
MKSSLVRTAVVTSLITTLAVSAIAMYVAPRLMNPTSPMEGMQSAVYTGPNQSDSAQAASQTGNGDTPQLQRRSTVTRRASAPRATATTTRDSYGEPVRHHRSTGKSALIVAGSAGTGAAIGAIAGGGKGAAIGALSGGAAGLIYDRLTANK